PRRVAGHGQGRLELRARLAAPRARALRRTMEPRSTLRLESLFARALELEPEARASWLVGLSGADAELRAELDSLLVHLERSSRFLARPATDAFFGALPPERIAAYRILRE